MMTVAQLRELLDGQPDDAVVVLAKDGEGNDFSPVDGATAQVYRPTNAWSGEIRAGGAGMQYGLRAGEVAAVVLWPVN